MITCTEVLCRCWLTHTLPINHWFQRHTRFLLTIIYWTIFSVESQNTLPMKTPWNHVVEHIILLLPEIHISATTTNNIFVYGECPFSIHIHSTYRVGIYMQAQIQRGGGMGSAHPLFNDFFSLSDKNQENGKKEGREKGQTNSIISDLM